MSYFVVGTMIVSALVGAQAARNQATANRAIANNNAKIAEMQAQDDLKRGEDQAMLAQRRARQIASAQRASYAARGIDVSEGTAADIIDQTDFFGQVDAATARTNARKDAWAHTVAQNNYGIQSAANDPNNAFNTSLLTSAPAVAGQWYRTKG